MEALAGLGAFSAIATIVIEFDRIHKRVKRCARNLNYAKAEFEGICKDIKIFVDEMDWFRIIGIEHEELDSCLAIKASGFSARIAERGACNIEKIEGLLESVRDLRSDTHASKPKYLIARWKWHTKKEELGTILGYVNSVKSSAMFLIQLILLELFLNKKHTDNSPLSSEEIHKMLVAASHLRI